MSPPTFTIKRPSRNFLLVLSLELALLCLLARSAHAFGGGVGGIGSVGSVSIGAVGNAGSSGRVAGVNVSPAAVRVGGGAGATPPVVPRQTPKPRSLLSKSEHAENEQQGEGNSRREARREEREEKRSERKTAGGDAVVFAAADATGATATKAKKTKTAAESAPAPSACSAANGAPYDGCISLPSGGTFFWNSTAADAAAGAASAAADSSLVHGALEAPPGLGYSSFAFPSRPGAMVGAKALVLRECADCPSGAALDSYSLDGKKGAQVVLDPSAVEVVSSSARKLPDNGGLAAEFVAKLPNVAGASDPSQVQWISASGPLKPDGVKPAIHTTYADGVVNLLSSPAAGSKAKKKGATAATTAGTALTAEQLAADKLRRRRLHRAHAWLMGIAWAVLAPLAIGTAATLKSVGGTVRMPGATLPFGVRIKKKNLAKWYVAHTSLLLLTMALTACGLGTGLAIRKPTDHGRKLAHEVIGYVICGVVAVQASSALFRPPNVAGNLNRKRWLWAHRLTGLSTAVLAFANLILGLVLADRGSGLIALASVVWGGIVLAFVGKKAVDVAAAARAVESDGDGFGKLNDPIPSRWYASIWGGGGSRASASNKGNASKPVASAAGPSEVELGTASNGVSKA